MKFFILCKKTPLGCKKHEREEMIEKLWKPLVTQTVQEEPIKLNIQQMEDKENKTTQRVIDKSQFCLPSVKELAKQFTKDDNMEIKKRSYPRVENKNQKYTPTDFPENEPEVDYSTVPVSEIILHLQKAAEAPDEQTNHKDIMYYNIAPLTQMEICRKVGSKILLENRADKKTGTGKFNGKEVHSLTARSISKEFREGLKNNSYQKNYYKIDRSSSGGESDQGDIICSKVKPSPMPSVDLKNMKKFWEEIITANSNSTKQK